MVKDKVTLWDVRNRFMAYNRQHGINYGDVPNGHVRDISAIIVFKASNYAKPYNEQERSYRVTNRGGKAFFEGMSGQSMFGDCFDGTIGTWTIVISNRW